MFYVIVFSVLAVLLVVAGITVFTRNRARLDAEEPRGPSADQRRQRKAQRAQSKAARRKRH
jgi:hypothetical protein